MLNKDDIIKILNENDIFADNFILDAFIKTWKIEAIYEDENGIEYFDEIALQKIKNALANKESGQELYTVETIKKQEPVIESPVVQSETAEEIKAFEEEDDDEEWEESSSDGVNIAECKKEESLPNESDMPKDNEIESSEQSIEASLPEVIEEKPYTELTLKPESELKNITLDITNQTLSVLAQAIAEKITGDVSDYLKRAEWVEEAINLGMFKKDNQIMASKINELVQDNKVLIKKLQELENIEQRYIKVFGNIYVKKSK